MTRVVETIKDLKAIVRAAKKAGKTIGLVPTMGALHDGHLTLAREAREENDVVIMSIFVNPTQFGPNEDFEAYPRDLISDTALAESVDVDVVFAPSVVEMYPTDGGIKISAGRAAEILCGASRPGHFDGVLQVVAKLFHLAEPTRAYFGQKDAQQVAIISTMVRDFNFPLELRTVAIVREADGLAKSSRNVYLTEEERKQAVGLYEGLAFAKNAILSGKPMGIALMSARDQIERNTGGKLDYLECLTYPDLKPIDGQTTDVLLAAAVYIGNTRLIDNLLFNLKETR
ncbi:MAG: pantoate--beta-alanine ligase [Solibacillus sp.]